jgi:hypothetical protein
MMDNKCEADIAEEQGMICSPNPFSCSHHLYTRVCNFMFHNTQGLTESGNSRLKSSRPVSRFKLYDWLYEGVSKSFRTESITK